MKNIYVGNLPHSTTESELRTVFEAHGAVEKVSIVTDRETGRARGFGFVEMTNAPEADKAIAALNGTELGGRALKINEAHLRPTVRRAEAGVEESGLVAAEAADAGAMIIRAMHASRANHAGSFLVSWKQPDA